MSIHIIKHGTLPQERTYKVKCDKCKGEFSCHRSDLRFEHPRPGEPEFAMVGCPTLGCGTTCYPKY